MTFGLKLLQYYTKLSSYKALQYYTGLLSYKASSIRFRIEGVSERRTPTPVHTAVYSTASVFDGPIGIRHSISLPILGRVHRDHKVLPIFVKVFDRVVSEDRIIFPKL